MTEGESRYKNDFELQYILLNTQATTSNPRLSARGLLKPSFISQQSTDTSRSNDTAAVAVALFNEIIYFYHTTPNLCLKINHFIYSDQKLNSYATSRDLRNCQITQNSVGSKPSLFSPRFGQSDGQLIVQQFNSLLSCRLLIISTINSWTAEMGDFAFSLAISLIKKTKRKA